MSTHDNQDFAKPPWRAFEDEVAEMLALSGYDVAREQILLHKKVDLLISERKFGKTIIAAVECKHHNTCLTLAALRAIEVDYLPLFENKAIDYLLVVSLNAPAPAALTKIQESRFLRHQTIAELRFSPINFTAYLYELERKYKSEGLDRYYIPLSSRSGNTPADMELDPYVEDWLSRDDANPMALLGSYGSGKSTFLLHLAQLCAARFRQGSFSRVPILIPLGEICSEQTIEGLLGRHFTHLHPTPGYNFQLFQHMNYAGRFLLLLDGFDEMKHSMTPNVFRYTFREVLKLVTPRSKVILSGRPSAFLTPEEHMEFLHAVRIRNGHEITIDDQPQFEEVQLSPFNRDQITAFIEKYRDYLKSERTHLLNVQIPKKEDFLQSPVLLEIASRPIQLKMLFVVLPAYRGNIDRLSVRELYTFFVELLLERETSKDARKMVGDGSLKLFLESLAYFVWLKGGEFVGVDDIPDACFKCATNDEKLVGVIRRDLISGSFVEVKYPNRLFFPHRSILEYLVAEFALDYFRAKAAVRECSKALGSEPNFDFVEDRVSPEIVDFMIAASGHKEREGAFTVLRTHRRPISEKSARFFLSSASIPAAVSKAAQVGDPWGLALLAAYRANGQWNVSSDETRKLARCVGATFEDKATLNLNSFYGRLFTALLLFGQEAAVGERETCVEIVLLGAFRHTSIMKVRYQKQDIECRVRPDFVETLANTMLEPRYGLSSRHTLGPLIEVLISKLSEKIGWTDWYARPRHPLVAATSEFRFEISPELHEQLNDTFDEATVREAAEKRKR